MKLTKETYYAIRVGDQKDRHPYFKVRTGCFATPLLLPSKKEAVAHMIPNADEKVVHVELRELK